jgi:hypothetical protein
MFPFPQQPRIGGQNASAGVRQCTGTHQSLITEYFTTVLIHKQILQILELLLPLITTGSATVTLDKIWKNDV